MMTWVLLGARLGHALGFFRALGGQQAMNPNFLVPVTITVSDHADRCLYSPLPVLRKSSPGSGNGAIKPPRSPFLLPASLFAARITVSAFHPFPYFRF